MFEAIFFNKEPYELQYYQRRQSCHCPLREGRGSRGIAPLILILCIR
jgi:hypothetical protein